MFDIIQDYQDKELSNLSSDESNIADTDEQITTADLTSSIKEESETEAEATINSIFSYLKDIGQFKLLTAEEEVDLAKRIKNGDSDAKDILINSNLRLVVHIAKDYYSRYSATNPSMQFSDYIQEGSMGLIKAAEHFDYTRGRFTTLATLWIKQYITQALVKQGNIIHVPEYLVRAKGRIINFISEYEQINGEKPSDDEISQTLQIPLSRVKNALGSSKCTLPWEVNQDNDDEQILPSMYIESKSIEQPDVLLMRSELRLQIIEAIKELPNRTQIMVMLRFGLIDGVEHTYEEIAKEFYMTRENVRKIVSGALTTLAKNSHTFIDQEVD